MLKKLKNVFHWYKSNTNIRNTIIDVIASLNINQRLLLISYYNNKYKSNLIRDISYYTRGPLRDCLLSLLMSTNEYICQWIDYALSKKDINLLIIILCTLTESQFHSIKLLYNQLHPKNDLKKQIESKTSNWFHKRNIMYFLLNIYNENRLTFENNNKEEQIINDVNNIMRASLNIKNIDKQIFIDIFSNRNLFHIFEVDYKYKIMNQQSQSLIQLIDQCFKENSEVGHACKIILYYSTRRYELLSDLLFKAMKTPGPNYEFLNRIIITHCEYDLENIFDIFGKEKFQLWLREHFQKNNNIHYNYYRLLIKLCNFK
jgi:hypothetical protein